MVFVDKTLEQMLAEIGFSDPVKAIPTPIELKHMGFMGYSPEDREESAFRSAWNSRTKDPTKCYKVQDDSGTKRLRDHARKFDEILWELSRWHSFIRLRMPRVGYLTEISEAVSNAIEWGGGISGIDYYFSPTGAVVAIHQNNPLNLTGILDKIKQGFYPSSRPEKKGGDTTSHGGGCGLQMVKDSKHEFSYNGNATLILFKRETAEAEVKEYS